MSSKACESKKKRLLKGNNFSTTNYYYLFNQTTSLHNLMYYLLEQQENWDIHELHFPCDFAQNNHKPNICNYSVTMVTLKAITYYFAGDLLFIQRG